VSSVLLRLATGLLAITLSWATAADTGADSFQTGVIAELDQPWALAFLPDGGILVTEKRGSLKLISSDGNATDIRGVPEVAYGGQGGLGDVALHPEFNTNRLVYLSYAEKGSGGRGAVVARARLTPPGALEDLEVIWRQLPKVGDSGHYGHRILFGPAGYLWISSGERRQFDPAQDLQSNLGKIIRLNPDGSAPADNPFAGQGAIADQVWSLGHRNPLGFAFDRNGRLWNVEMGPSGGDELNLVLPGANYGYPEVSEGKHYGGKDIPDHHLRPEFEAPKVSWTPVISPSSIIFYDGSEFPRWQGDAFVSGLSSMGLVRLEFEGETAREAQRFSMGARIRAVKQGPDGALWVLEDGKGGRLLRLTRPTP
jgi:glucose/arabinose dehydrogenase